MAQREAAQRRPSIHDVASRAGVSAATVSKVMQGVPTVRPENVQRVNDAVEMLGYRLARHRQVCVDYANHGAEVTRAT